MGYDLYKILEAPPDGGRRSLDLVAGINCIVQIWVDGSVADCAEAHRGGSLWKKVGVS